MFVIAYRHPNQKSQMKSTSSPTYTGKRTARCGSYKCTNNRFVYVIKENVVGCPDMCPDCGEYLFWEVEKPPPETKERIYLDDWIY